MGRGWSCRVSGLGWVLEDPWLCAGQNSRAIVKWRQVYLDRYTFNWGFPDSLLGKESACNARDSGHAGSIPGSGRSPGEGLGNPLQYSWAFPGGTVVKNLPTNAEDARGTSLIPGWWRSPGVGHDNPFQYYYLENSINRRAWQSMGSQRVRHNWVYTHTHTPVFLPEKFYGQRWWAAVQRRDWARRHTHSAGRTWSISETPQGMGVTLESERGPDLGGG